MDKSGSEGQAVIDLSHNEIQWAQGDKETTQSPKKINRESNDWVKEDITAVKETRHATPIGGNGNLPVFPRDMEGTAALAPGTAHHRKG